MARAVERGSKLTAFISPMLASSNNKHHYQPAKPAGQDKQILHHAGLER